MAPPPSPNMWLDVLLFTFHTHACVRPISRLLLLHTVAAARLLIGLHLLHCCWPVNLLARRRPVEVLFEEGRQLFLYIRSSSSSRSSSSRSSSRRRSSSSRLQLPSAPPCENGSERSADKPQGGTRMPVRPGTIAQPSGRQLLQHRRRLDGHHEIVQLESESAHVLVPRPLELRQRRCAESCPASPSFLSPTTRIDSQMLVVFPPAE